ncbi:hypothetical protein DFP72DRAFT_1175722 [Ephemerocybe angulata]|uniref:Uncharacterized protein n=1 Tax=Ephemerocybe angulata TaxID=980116 RepID=A0A8H6HI87_9AGAR|nr:hypothetical protein DFP72DRAFT_1175722 [Tulosesus angulatus]
MDLVSTSSAEQRQRRHWAAADSTSSRPLGIGGAMYDGIHTLDADSTPENDTKDRGCVVLPDQASTPAPEYTASTSTPPPPTPTPAPRGLVTDPRALLALISSVPPQTFHSYCLSHLNPANVLIVCSVERRSTTGKAAGPLDPTGAKRIGSIPTTVLLYYGMFLFKASLSSYPRAAPSSADAATGAAASSRATATLRVLRILLINHPEWFSTSPRKIAFDTRPCAPNSRTD